MEKKEYIIIGTEDEFADIAGFTDTEEGAMAFIDVINRGLHDDNIHIWYGELTGKTHYNGGIKRWDALDIRPIGDDECKKIKRIKYNLVNMSEYNLAVCQLTKGMVSKADIIHGWFDSDINYGKTRNKNGIAVFRFDGSLSLTQEEILDICGKVIATPVLRKTL